MKRFLWPVLLAVFLGLVVAQGLEPVATLAKSTSSSSSSSSSKSSSSGFSSSSRSSSSSPSSSSTGSSGFSSSTGKSTGTSSSAPASSASSGSSGFSSSSGASTSAGQALGAKSTSSFAAAGSASVSKQAAAKSYTEYSSRFGKSGNPVSPSSQSSSPTVTRTYTTYHEYYTYRDSYYSSRGWFVPSYAYHSYPSFGLWDGVFLWALLSHSTGPGFYYNNWSDPGVQAWRREAENQAKDNAELRQQLKDLDAKVEDMKKTGVAAKPGTLPEGVDDSVAYAADQVVKEGSPTSANKGGGWKTWALLIIVIGLSVFAVKLFMNRRKRFY